MDRQVLAMVIKNKVLKMSKIIVDIWQQKIFDSPFSIDKVSSI